MNTDLETTKKNFEKRGFSAFACDDSKHATELVNEILSKGMTVSSIGVGNSETIRTLGLYENFQTFTKNVYIHSPVGTEETDRKSLAADYYFTSANAVTREGEIINIDGTGNRTAATCFGPKNVIYIIGKNKIVNNLNDASSRAKATAVKLAKKYNLKTPCVSTGKCEECSSPESICAVTTIHRKKPFGTNITIIIVNENLGI
jgi:L-lactate utilization protein LutB